MPKTELCWLKPGVWSTIQISYGRQQLISWVNHSCVHRHITWRLDWKQITWDWNSSPHMGCWHPKMWLSPSCHNSQPLVWCLSGSTGKIKVHCSEYTEVTIHIGLGRIKRVSKGILRTQKRRQWEALTSGLLGYCSSCAGRLFVHYIWEINRLKLLIGTM